MRIQTLALILLVHGCTNDKQAKPSAAPAPKRSSSVKTAPKSAPKPAMKAAKVRLQIKGMPITLSDTEQRKIETDTWAYLEKCNINSRDSKHVGRKNLEFRTAWAKSGAVSLLPASHLLIRFASTRRLKTISGKVNFDELLLDLRGSKWSPLPTYSKDAKAKEVLEYIKCGLLCTKPLLGHLPPNNRRICAKFDGYKRGQPH